MEREASKLAGVPETMLIPLWCKAAETERPGGIIQDDKSLEIIARIDYDFSRFQDACLTSFAIVTRTEIIDEMVTEYLNRRPKGTIVNLGSGLDTRFSRVDNGKMKWIDIGHQGLLPFLLHLQVNTLSKFDYPQNHKRQIQYRHSRLFQPNSNHFHYLSL